MGNKAAPKPSTEFKYQEGEKVLCFYGHALYQAKIMEADVKEEKNMYYIHYSGWNKKWDEWIAEKQLLKYDDAGLAKQKELFQAIGASLNKRKKVVKESSTPAKKSARRSKTARSSPLKEENVSDIGTDDDEELPKEHKDKRKNSQHPLKKGVMRKEKKLEIPPRLQDSREEQVDEGTDFDFPSTTDYFTKLGEVLGTFANRPIRINDLEELVEQCGKNVAGLSPAELKFHEEIALVAGALYDTYSSIEEESLFSTAQKLQSLKGQLEEMQENVSIASKEINWWYNHQASLQKKISELVTDKTEAEIEVRQLEIVALQLKLTAKQSASAQRAFEDAMDKARLSQNRVCFFQEELDAAEEQERDSVIQIEEVEEEYAQDSKSLSMLKEKVKNIETSLASGLASVDSSKKITLLEETAQKQRRALFILQKQLVKLAALRKSM